MNLLMLKRLASLFTVLMVIGLGVQLAWWGWRFFGPKSATLEPTAEAVDPAIAHSIASHLFGDPGTAIVTSAAAVENSSGIRLKGVYAVDGKTLSAAVVNTGGRDTSVRLNEKITDSITLVDVKADHIVISRAGVRAKIAIERSAGKAAGSGNINAGAPPASFRLNVTSSSRNTFSLSRGELNTVLQDPRQINFLGSIVPAPNGGVQINDAPQGTLVQKLGLQAGDIITSINGQPVNGTGDLARFYGQFGSTSNIRAEIKRGGSPLLLVYAINP
ncbi:MAG: type II secretion system protein N [Pseudomonadota bacterium]